MPQEPPVLVAYDGSELSKAALRHAAELFPDFRALVATVWEPELPELPVVDPGGGTGFSISADPETVEEIDRGGIAPPRRKADPRSGSSDLVTRATVNRNVS